MGVRAALLECERIARDGGAAALADTVRAAHDRLDEPMRVAVAGQIKRGKSTLVNALLGREVAPTGRLETTFTVSEFHDHPAPRVLVHRKRRRPALEIPVEEFRRFTVRDPAQAAVLREVRRVEYGLPEPWLRSFRLVDTPGLASVHGADAGNTAAFLGIDRLDITEQQQVADGLAAVGRSAAEVHEESVDELTSADAVIYLFDRAMNEYDLAAVGRFLGPLSPGLTALKAFGVLSRCDETYWPPGPDQPGDPDPLTWDPLAVAGRVVDGYLRRPESRRMFATILPVAGLVGLGARALDDADLGRLDELGRGLEPPRLAAALEDAGYFATAATLPGVALPARQRAALIQRLGAWGCLRAALYLRAGLSTTEVRDRLVDDSGITRLRELIGSHFGNRATLIKLDHGLSRVEATVLHERLDAQRARRPAPPAVAPVADRVQRLRRDNPGFRQLAALTAFYNDELDLKPDEVDELLRITGENGVSGAARLGLGPDAPLSLLQALADQRVDAWTRRLQEPDDVATHEAVGVILAGYDRVAQRVRAARRLLETDDDGDDGEGDIGGGRWSPW